MGKYVILSSSDTGLLLGSVAERLGGSGAVLNVFAGKQPNLTVTNFFNFTEQERNIILSVSFSQLSQLIKEGQYTELNEDTPLTTRDPQRRAEVLAARELRAKKRVEQQAATKAAMEHGFEALIVAVQGDVLSVFQSLFPFLLPGHPFCVYSEYIQPLIIVHEIMKRTGSGVGLELTETWTREYQVLPNRTHPLNQMNGASGYVLFGYKIKPQADGIQFGVGAIHKFADKDPSSAKKQKPNTPLKSEANSESNLNEPQQEDAMVLETDQTS